MQIDSLDDTIVAVATAWEPAALGVVRVSGPRTWPGVEAILDPSHSQPLQPGRAVAARVRVGSLGVVPAALLCFRGPHSYTGDDLIELHLPGSPPLLRALCAELIAAGARRARPGEFTARAYVNGRLDAGQVQAVAGLVYAQDRAAARQAARIARGSTPELLAELRERIVELLARVEAGIDFSDEEDVRFITAEELAGRLCELRGIVRSLARAAAGELHVRRPRVALAGLPNAGKSTLFNALLGRSRAIVSPLVGTTRDVIEAELEADGLRFVLQDTAGIGSTCEELDAAAHVAAEQAAAQADVVVWVHEAMGDWGDVEREVLGRIDVSRRVLALSKSDADVNAHPAAQTDFARVVRVSARTGQGLDALRRAIGRTLREQAAAEAPLASSDALRAAEDALSRAAGLAEGGEGGFEAELVALELRGAVELLDEQTGVGLTEEVLGRVFAQFCVGK